MDVDEASAANSGEEEVDGRSEADDDSPVRAASVTAAVSGDQSFPSPAVARGGADGGIVVSITRGRRGGMMSPPDPSLVGSGPSLW